MKYFVMAAFAAALFTSSAYAGSCGGGDHVHNPQKMAVKYFKQMDSNGDDVITKKEFEASPLAKMVKSFDALQPNVKGEVEKQNFIKSFVKAHSRPNQGA